QRQAKVRDPAPDFEHAVVRLSEQALVCLVTIRRETRNLRRVRAGERILRVALLCAHCLGPAGLRFRLWDWQVERQSASTALPQLPLPQAPQPLGRGRSPAGRACWEGRHSGLWFRPHRSTLTSFLSGILLTGNACPP